MLILRKAKIELYTDNRSKYFVKSESYIPRLVPIAGWAILLKSGFTGFTLFMVNIYLSY